MRAWRSLMSFSSWAILAAAPFAVGCSSDDDNGTGPSSALVAAWNATSFVALGQDFIALGMDLSITFTSNGSFTLVVQNDLIGICSPDLNCTQTGTYTATTSQVTIDPGTAEATTFNYTIQGTTLTLTGSIDGNPVMVTLTRT